MSDTPFDLAPFDDGYVEEPPAPEPPSRVEESRRPPPGPTRIEQVCLQLGHRLAIAALLLLVGAVGATLKRHDAYWILILLAFVAGDAALVFGLIASWLQRGRRWRNREPLGIILFSLVLLLPTIALVVLAKADRLSPLIARIMGES